jgi:polysaccharide deacetylase family protein (PEP-CTERM system associated)
MTQRAFTVDVEDWRHSNLSSLATPPSGLSILPRALPLLLDLLAAFQIRATFFVLADVLSDVTPFRDRLLAEGHEIASHGSSHQLAYQQTEEEFRHDVTTAKTRLEDLFGVAVNGYRAPSWSITPAVRDYLRSLPEAGYRYDASLMPFATYLYGYPGCPRVPFRPVVSGEALELVEVPGTTARIGGRIFPFSGGFYLRVLPIFAILWLTRRAERQGVPVVYYVHPRELLVDQPVPRLTRKEHFIHTHGLGSVPKKLNTILRRGPFLLMDELVLEQKRKGLPVVAI